MNLFVICFYLYELQVEINEYWTLLQGVHMYT